MSLTIEKTKEYQQYQPAPGSPLHRALAVLVAAENDVTDIQTVLDRLQEQRTATAAIVDKVDWLSDLDTAAQSFARLPILDAMITAANGEKAKRSNVLRLALHDVFQLAQNLRSYQKEVDQWEQLFTDVPGRVTDSDRKRRKQAHDTLANYRTAVLAA